MVFKYYFLNFFIYKMLNWFCFVVFYCLGKFFYKKFCDDNLENLLEIGVLFEKCKFVRLDNGYIEVFLF